MQPNIIIIAIDGPAASGKGTLAKRVASHLEFRYLDTGKLYRALAFALRQYHIDFDDMPAILSVIDTLKSEDLDNPHLLDEQVGLDASLIAAQPQIREGLIAFQRNLATHATDVKGIVLDGRDIGTVIFPDADVKLFVIADAKTRAKRRFLQLQPKHPQISLKDIEADIIMRDKRDSEREVAPLKPANDALIFDTSDKDIDTVFTEVLAIITEKISDL